MSIFRFLRIPITYGRRATFTSLESANETKNSDSNNELDLDSEISLETSKEYLQSEAYQITYGNLPVWTHYRRNFKGPRPPRTRENCKRKGKINTASPCPICRDKYLIVDYQNLDLIKQFISPHGGHILDTSITGLCQHQHYNVRIAIEKAKDLGLFSFDIPHRHYNYNLYKKKN